MTKNAKFEFTGETKVVFGVTLNRIRAVTAIAALGIAAGDLGGWIEREENLQVYGNAWVYGNARVYGMRGSLAMRRSLVMRGSILIRETCCDTC